MKARGKHPDQAGTKGKRGKGEEGGEGGGERSQGRTRGELNQLNVTVKWKVVASTIKENRSYTQDSLILHTSKDISLRLPYSKKLMYQKLARKNCKNRLGSEQKPA